MYVNDFRKFSLKVFSCHPRNRNFQTKLKLNESGVAVLTGSRFSRKTDQYSLVGNVQDI